MQKISLIKDQSLPTSVKVQKILEQFKKNLQDLYGEQLENIILFGSQARGEAKADSDIDVLIVLREMTNYSQEIEKTSFNVAKICLENDVVISRSFATIEQLQKSYSPFFLNIKREGIIL
ncbi:MAG: nucleotidyltransferase domain-containing protein [Gomphosphaeria aponina SAG 52.96 = DSM 107014]|uniref:Nucleotidyltransferase domain-containing protein n=1 Tax=Gomphosphaeria aponina SAG 52.96 = DSM 107014 TaxID=1521640 RepID=A0A941JKY8_9CHRO|nr:nucleotidyltransferase domain-containing protein [Gomphosphaeria aponina SAG 52.96 = DSM 107014]